MKRYSMALFFIISFFHLNSLIAQGGVNVKLIQVDSLNSNYLNREVKIDFKSTEKIKKNSFSIKYLWTSQTKVSIENKEVDLTEYNGRGIDYWNFDKAFLELYSYKPNLVFRVSKSIIKEIKNDSIKFQWTIQPFNSKGKNSTEIKPEVKDVWVEKN